MSWRRVVAWIGGVLFAFGVLVLLFVAYQLWGTSITTQLHQDALRSQFNHELAVLRAHHKATSTTTSTTLQSTTTTTQPISGVAPLTPGVAPVNGQPIGTINIPAIGINYVVVQGTDEADLQLGPGHYLNTPLPGQPGNAAIAGHRTTYLHPFYNLNELHPGDPIYVTTTQGRFKYEVTNSQTVVPTDLAVLNPTPVPTLTLTTCNPRFSAAQRLVVQATLVTPPAPVPKAVTTTSSAKTGRSATPKLTANGLGGDGGSAWWAIPWGLAVLVVGVGMWKMLVAFQTWSGRVGVGFVGALVMLVVLFFFFQSVTPLLPASF